MNVTRMNNKIYLLTLLSFLTSCGAVSTFETSVKMQKEHIKKINTVTNLDAANTLAAVSRRDLPTYSVYRKSVAQVVFPKVIKAGLLVGANYGEGFLLRDGEVIKLVDLKGANIGLQAGGQSYSQVTYILTEERYQEILNTNRLSLNGSISYGLNGKLQNSRLSSDAIKGDLFTVVFNETGTVYGASLEGLYYSLR